MADFDPRRAHAARPRHGARGALVAIVALMMLLRPGDSRADVSWQHGELEPTLHAAQSQHRLVLLDFYADWCGPCQTMDVMVWSRADVSGVAAEGYVALKVDTDSREGAALRQRYNIAALPTVLATRSDGTEIDRLTGDTSPQTVLAALAAWRRGESTLSVLEAQLAHGAADATLRLEVGTRYADRGDAARALPLLERVIHDDADNAHGFAASALLVIGERLYLRALRAPRDAVPWLQQLASRFPNAPACASAQVALAAALHQLGRDDEALRGLDAWLAASPTSVRAERAHNASAMMLRAHWNLPHAEQIARAGLIAWPNDHALIDTLADLVFALGRAAESVELEQRAARLDAGNAHYREQLARFRAGPAPR